VVSDALRAVMLAADGAGTLAGDEVRRGRAEHPSCGDVVEVQVRIADAAIAELAWRASGCPACMAVAAAARVALRAAPLQAAPARLRARLEALGGLAPHERHAERLFLRALAQALER
jgi:NifU-like protein involved in Fe-S cluster formation